ncbi:MAG TPA: IS21 family transposase [Solirubrobacteraceae bacterium]|jgi:transposase|nr:IS21 family transposase [Solirubrobacteraceae bacterium]
MTATWRSRDELVHQIVTLAADRMSKRAIARTVGVSRNTVKAVLAAHAAQRGAAHSALPEPTLKAPRPRKTDVFRNRIAELFVRYPDITARRVFEILCAEGFDGGYTAVKKCVRTLRAPRKPAPSLVAPSYGPGEMAESDWSPYAIDFTAGGRMTVQAFSYVLTYSPRKAFSVYPSCDLFALMDGHERAFDRFQGCAHRCIYDSQKPVVSRWEGTQPIYNPRFLAFAAHYEFRPRAVRGEPNAKPRVERSFWDFERSFLNGRSFADLDDMRTQITEWLDGIVDPRRRHGQTCLERFAEEQPKLIPLPRHPYDTARVIYRVCSIDGFVDWEGNRYAVPYGHVTDILPVRVTQRELFVYAADLACVARHELAPRGAGQKLDPAGLHPPPRGKSPVDLDQLAVAFDGLGPGGAAFFRLLSAGPPRVWGHQARCILVLRARYATADLDAALAHAARFGALEHRAVERILEARSSPRTLDEYVAEDTARRLAQALGGQRTPSHDLTTYDRLPLARASSVALASVAPSIQESCPCPSATESPAAAPPAIATSPSSDSDDTSRSSD